MHRIIGGLQSSFHVWHACQHYIVPTQQNIQFKDMDKKKISPNNIHKVKKLTYNKHPNLVVHELLHLFLYILPSYMCFNV